MIISHTQDIRTPVLSLSLVIFIVFFFLSEWIDTQLRYEKEVLKANRLNLCNAFIPQPEGDREPIIFSACVA